MEEVLLRYENSLVMFATWILVGLIYKLVPWMRGSLAARLQPLAPIVVSSGLVWIPGLMPADSGIGERILLGIILGFASGSAHKMLKQGLLGEDSRVRPKEPQNYSLALPTEATTDEQVVPEELRKKSEDSEFEGP